eukprot:NODE_742_length_2133_cov_95.609453_g708_i0.p2 GENE.NODE_742_length_2133_cov_95.609453_g708_i0~~NODE_742_length_2133_cov_95.609453_g708_i0.p2  ORF type:complete len:313 (+),score=120.82 NODE_742_length_2133_cov_95.609453_g708_i0:950-1888(+)
MPEIADSFISLQADFQEDLLQVFNETQPTSVFRAADNFKVTVQGNVHKGLTDLGATEHGGFKVPKKVRTQMAMFQPLFNLPQNASVSLRFNSVEELVSKLAATSQQQKKESEKGEGSDDDDDEDDFFGGDEEEGPAAMVQKTIKKIQKMVDKLPAMMKKKVCQMMTENDDEEDVIMQYLYTMAQRTLGTVDSVVVVSPVSVFTARLNLPVFSLLPTLQDLWDFTFAHDKDESFDDDEKTVIKAKISSCEQKGPAQLIATLDEMTVALDEEEARKLEEAKNEENEEDARQQVLMQPNVELGYLSDGSRSSSDL